jgi:hypothetical protein
MGNSHLASIGFPVSDRDQFARLLMSLIGKAVEDVPARNSVKHFRWTDPSGASIAFHLDSRGAIDCITPFFSPREPNRWQVTTSAPEDDACAHCGGAMCDVFDSTGEMVTRAVVQWLQFQTYRDWLSNPQKFEIEVVAFAHEASFFATSEEYHESQRHLQTRPGRPDPVGPTDKPLMFADNAFVPEGSFAAQGHMGDRATALYAGRVEASERLINGATGADFQLARIRTLPGLLDTVFDPKACKGDPVVGNIAFVRAWLVGRPNVPPPEAKRGWVAKLLGR